MAELTTLARPYAKAAFEYAHTQSNLQAWADQLGVAAGVVAEPKVAGLLNDPAKTPSQLSALIIEIMQEDASSAFANFVKILADNRRLLLLPAINGLFSQLKANLEASVDVEVVSAFDLTDAETQKIVSVLKRKLNKEINVHTKTDASLIGGVVIRAGDMVIDGSVRGRLNKLAEAMNS
jgi:F-type H+-transporting ATPase subunit delta